MHFAFVEEIETVRLLLLRPTKRDGIVLSKLWQTDEVQGYMGGVLSEQDAEMRMSKILEGWEGSAKGLWAVFEKGGEEPIGLCGLGDFEEEVEIIYKFFPQYWGKGYATEAASMALRYGFETLKLACIVGVTQEVNRASQRVLEKLGMQHVRNLMKWGVDQRYYELKGSV